MDRARIDEVLKELTKLYPEAKPELRFTNPFETLVATILSAQCTDQRVNKVTESLFQRFPDAFSMARLEPEALEPLIRECGLYRSKAKNIVEACRILVEKYNGCVPDTREALMALPGVGRKTAGVVLLAAFGEAEIPVDTHVFRVSRRIGLADGNTPEQVEAQLRERIPKEIWAFGHHLLIWHGRRVCAARKPACERCPLSNDLCEACRMDSGERATDRE
ncbi:MAG: endonuclease III [Christensenellales bacterium]|nr:endonuclease III [Christensenellales bacterium]